MKIGDKYLFVGDDFDGKTTFPCTVTEIHEDYAILTCDELGTGLWYDEDNKDMFKEVR